jgi:sugar phosphate isomerase/epimerase
MMLTEPVDRGADVCRPALRLGVRAHDFGRLPADELAGRIAAQGFSCVQLAPNKAVAGLNLQAGGLNSAVARDIGAAFRRHGVGIEVLGCYINPIHPDREIRAALCEVFKDHLRCARDFGCGLVALESGSVNADYSPHPANQGEEAFQTLLASLRELVDEAGRCGCVVGLEAVHCHTVSDARKMRRVLEAVHSKHLGVVFDPANLLSAEKFPERDRIIQEALDLLGERLVAIHAKDLRLESGQLKTVPTGSGDLDFGPVLNWVRRERPEIAVLLEEVRETDASASARWLMDKFLKDPS